jgi:hypothetical protein
VEFQRLTKLNNLTGQSDNVVFKLKGNKRKLLFQFILNRLKKKHNYIKFASDYKTIIIADQNVAMKMKESLSSIQKQASLTRPTPGTSPSLTIASHHGKHL